MSHEPTRPPVNLAMPLRVVGGASGFLLVDPQVGPGTVHGRVGYVCWRDADPVHGGAISAEEAFTRAKLLAAAGCLADVLRDILDATHDAERHQAEQRARVVLQLVTGPESATVGG